MGAQARVVESREFIRNDVKLFPAWYGKFDVQVWSCSGLTVMDSKPPKFQLKNYNTEEQMSSKYILYRMRVRATRVAV